MSSNAFYNEESNGFWQLKIIDGDGSSKNISYDSVSKTYSTTTGKGNLVSWKINISGHRKSTELKNPYPPTGIVVNDAKSANPPTSFSFNPSDGLKNLEYWVAIYDANGTPVYSERKIGIELNFIASDPVLDPGKTYKFTVRAYDPNSKLWSSIQAKEWTEN